MHVKKHNAAFTLIELLVVVAMIGILATFIIGQINKARKKAQVAHFASQLDQIEKAFAYTFFEENRSNWWTEAEIGTFNPTLTYINNISSGPLSGFSDWYPNSPDNYLADAEYRFDSDGDTYGECGTGGQTFSGVNILVYGIPFDDIEQIDMFRDGVAEDVDNDGDPDGDVCGKIRYRVSAVTGEPLLIYSMDLDDEAYN